MNKAVVTAALLFAAPCVVAPCALAQEDRIVWTDGSVTEKVRVTDFTWKAVTFTQRNRDETRSADTVASLDVEKVRDTYKRALAAATDDDAYSQYRLQIDKLGDKPFLAQFGFVAAARLLIKNGEANEAFALMEKLAKDHPRSGFLPDLYRIKLDFYLAQEDGAKSAQTVAKQFRDIAISEAWPDGFVAEAEFYTLMARAAAGEIEGGALENELNGLYGRTKSSYPNVADRAKVQLAHAQRKNNQLAEARKSYAEILDKDGLGSSTRAQALIGLGYTELQSGDPSNTEPYRAALMSFLRVYLAEGVAKELKAEALYNASQAAEKWGGPDSGAMARRLRGYLRRDYPDSTWAKK